MKNPPSLHGQIGVPAIVDDILGNFEDQSCNKGDYWFVFSNYKDLIYNLSITIILGGGFKIPNFHPQLDKGKREGFFIECGAFDGETISNSLFFELNRNFTGAILYGYKNSFLISSNITRISTIWR